MLAAQVTTDERYVIHAHCHACQYTPMMPVTPHFLHVGRGQRRVSLGLCRDTMTMVQALESIWPQCPIGHPFHVGVVLGNLVADGSADLPLYDEQHKRNRLADVMDQLDRKYGRHTLYFGGMMGMEDAAPTRISFTQIPTADEF